MTHSNFGIEDAPKRVCQLNRYQLGHSFLVVVIRPNKQYKEGYVVFEDVRYIEGPVSWVGADFTERTDQESWKFAKSIGVGGQKGAYTLFEVEINRRTLVYPNKIRSWLFRIYLAILSISPLSNYKKRFFRVLARRAYLRSDNIPKE